MVAKGAADTLEDYSNLVRIITSKCSGNNIHVHDDGTNMAMRQAQLSQQVISSAHYAGRAKRIHR